MQSIVRVDVANDGTETTGITIYVDVATIDEGRLPSGVGAGPRRRQPSPDILLRDVAAGTTVLVSVDSKGNRGTPLRASAHFGNGRCVAFEFRQQPRHSDDNHHTDVFLRNPVDATTARQRGHGAGGERQRDRRDLRRRNRILFWSDVINLVLTTTNGRRDLFVRTSPPLDRPSRPADDGTEADQGAMFGSISRDGRS
jgi:hypothetical protein